MSARSTRDELTADALVKMMVGRDLSSFYKKEHDPHGSRGPVILEVKGITDGGRRVKPAASSCTRARCWASPGWSARAAPSWRA